MNNSQYRSIAQGLIEFWRHINRRRRVQLVVVFFFMLMSSVAEVATIGAVIPFLTAVSSPQAVLTHPFAKPVIDMLGITTPDEVLWPTTVMFASLAVASALIRITLLWVQTRLSYGIYGDIGSAIYRRTLYQPYLVHVRRNSSEVIAGITNKTFGLLSNVLNPVLTISTTGLTSLAIIAVLIAINPLVAIGLFLGLALVYAMLVFMSRHTLLRYSQTISQQQTMSLKALQEGLGGIRDVIIDSSQEEYSATFTNADRSLKRAQANVQIIGSWPRYAIESLAMVLIATAAYLLAAQPSGLLNAISVLGAVALGGQRLLPAIHAAYGSWTNLKGYENSFYDLLELLAQPLPAHLGGPESVSIRFNDSIHFKAVSFRYHDQAAYVLENLDLKIPKGSRVGFIGTTGSGKSTLLDIVMGLLEPSNGALLVDGVHVTPESQPAWRARIAHVPQSIYLSDSSIAENIAFGVPRSLIDHAQVRKAAALAQIAETIEAMPEAYATQVGERGVRLSGGQRQRIGIARALYKRADVIVFDEATSALDQATEDAVMHGIESLGEELTILMVAHRLTTLRMCNIICEVRSGRLARTGSAAEMLTNAG